ncbi:sigma factor-like helix-turn-helix DNA-binding protein [Noviherbaspirillum sp. Root189]|uniref:RNA polymerase sigma factor n=1 Tax=Noviherbaspirillum sp. Root189 TaxID=1736487 RepID=UPI0009E82F9C
MAAFEALPEHYRNVILLCDFGELGIEEIAERLELTTARDNSRGHICSTKCPAQVGE